MQKETDGNELSTILFSSTYPKYYHFNCNQNFKEIEMFYTLFCCHQNSVCYAIARLNTD